MADAEVQLLWQGEGLRFRGGRDGGPQLEVDGEGRAAPSPVQQLLLSLAGCMGADVVDIMNRSRAPISGLAVRVRAERAERPPRRLTRVDMHLIADGVADTDAPRLERALELSRQTYCSVLHSLRPDVQLAFTLERR